MTFASPLFGPLYFTAFCAALLSLIFGARLAPRLVVGLATYALTVAGLCAGLALRATHDDVSGEAFTLAPVGVPANVPSRLGRADGTDREISVDVFANARNGHGVAPFLALRPPDGVEIGGWAFDADNHRRCGAVVAVVAGRTFGGTYGLDRPDVGSVFGPDHRYTGYRILVAPASLGLGRHTLEMRCLDASGRSYAGPTTFLLEVQR
jgi:hypothetical protein